MPAPDPVPAPTPAPAVPAFSFACRNCGREPVAYGRGTCEACREEYRFAYWCRGGRL